MLLGELSFGSTASPSCFWRVSETLCLVSRRRVSSVTPCMIPAVPKLWTATVDEHRTAVRRAIFDAAWALLNERGPLSLTMSEIAARAGIGRATLYKYFADVETILLAAHHEQVGHHLQQVEALAAHHASPGAGLEAVLLHYATVVQLRERPTYDALRTLLHADPRLEAAHDQLRVTLVELISSSAKAGEVRDDIEPEFLAEYCLSALGAAGKVTGAGTPEALVRLLLDSLRSSVRRPRGSKAP